MTEQIKYVAIGDSFTEGVGDTLPGGRFDGDRVRGWADLVAQGVANATGETILYANLAIRGRLLKAIIDEQLQAALNLKPTLLSFNGGGNDMLRPGTKMQWITQATENALLQIMDAGVEPLLLSGANPTASLPSGQTVKLKGDLLVANIKRITESLNIKFTDNWNDRVLWSRQYWDTDRLHLAPVGHARVANNVLKTLGFQGSLLSYAEPLPRPNFIDESSYVYRHVLPWISRRLTGRSSGDGRTAKYPQWIEVHPE